MHEYDEQGNLLRTVATSSPEFDSQERRLLIVGSRVLAKIGPHGHFMDEATDPRAAASNYFGGYGYVPNEPIFDHAEIAVRAAEKAWRDQNPEGDPTGMIFTVRRQNFAVPTEGSILSG
ncbi:hypothetical protein D9V32_05545 [Mycetocola tolaasinivorans]|uniref:Uncharacterized protein n=1 Tax=Mycetocola tolaasinivorans TaxID=76635 RepID=A0A3L7A8F1_9MICO|nr:hypothetical protein [Mycetocola tolaasinivorans]RLP76334.1 hypothetical protein D9V32_05545 [Mycetocola tolaasinivorans]